MRLEQLASQLIKDYQETAKSEIKKGKSWNSLDQEQQQKRKFLTQNIKIIGSLLTSLH